MACLWVQGLKIFNTISTIMATIRMSGYTFNDADQTFIVND